LLDNPPLKTLSALTPLSVAAQFSPAGGGGAMRVTIEHREATSGVLGNHKDCYVDCTVNFSEEERAIIKERDLFREGFSVRTSTPPPTKTQFFSTTIMRVVGRFMMIGGFFYGLIVEGLAHAPTNFGAPILFIGIGLEIWGWLRTRKEDKRFESSEQEITVKQLLNSPMFTVHAWNPAGAKGIEQDIRENLVSLKTIIQNSAQIQAKQTFEL
jgi:hypothetical protein